MPDRIMYMYINFRQKRVSRLVKTEPIDVSNVISDTNIILPIIQEQVCKLTCISFEKLLLIGVGIILNDKFRMNGH